MVRKIVIKDQEEQEKIISSLNKRGDIKAERIKRLLVLPDLTKKENSPVKIIADRILNLPRFKDFDVMDFPRIVTVEQNFDVLNAPVDHPSRRESDTYYLDDSHILRTQTTTMWPFYLRDQEVLARLKKEGHVALLSPGIVYRKDEIDRKHFPAFHQIDGLYIARKDQQIITQKDLEDIESDIVKSIFGNDLEFRFLVDSFPFTDPSVQIEIKFNNDWIEVVGSGLVHQQVLRNLNLDPEIYNGWAFGFGIERLAMVKMQISDIRIFWSDDPKITSQFKDVNSRYKEVSKFPEISRDISFIIDKNINLNNYYEIVRDFAQDLIEEVKLIDSYEDEKKFGGDKKSYTFRIVYRSPERTLTNEEVNEVQDKIRKKTQEDLGAILR
jgi:phenylalanyl-tRNA synthetase alpha chain